MFDLTDKKALVTGASGGIGGEIAKALHAAGATVGLSGTREEPLQALATELGERAHVLPCNLSDGAAVDALPKQAIEAMGGLDILVNNAGITRDQIFMRMSDEEWQSVIDVNLTSTMRLCRGVMRPMMKSRWGRIINITTSFFTMLRPMFHPYGPTKAALEAMSAGHAGEFQSQGITVNVVVPGGPADTPMVPAVTNVDRKDLIPPESMIPPILWLCSDAASNVTGKRFVAANWDDHASVADARANSESLIAWPELANNPVWPGGKPTT